MASRLAPSDVLSAGKPSAHSAGLPASWQVLQSPLTGIWYDAPAPGSAPYVAIGDPVASGAVVGLVETMKVFNEITSEVSGIVRQIFVKRGDLVAAHESLIAIEPSATSEPGNLA